jgi:hypothetical protein
MNERLAAFTDKIMRINAVAPGTAMSAGGLVGAMSPRQAAVLDLKKKTLDLNAELAKKTSNHYKAVELFEAIEGSLQGLKTLAVIDGHRLAELSGELKVLRNESLRRS